MLTAILPIRLTSPFWSSVTGKDCLDRFIVMISEMEEIDRGVVVGEGDGVAGIAKEYGLEFAKAHIPGKIDLPFTHDETNELVQRVEGEYPIGGDFLLVVDHRNLLLSEQNLRQAIALHQNHQDARVISVSPCRDHPCQYRAYFNFLGCEIIHFFESSVDQDSEAGRGFDKRVLVKSGDGVGIVVRVQGCQGQVVINYSIPAEFSQGIVSKILPFTANAPLYDDQIELFIDGLGSETQLQMQEQDSLVGVVVTMLQPARSGEYDAVEHFTPLNATWELGRGGFVVEKVGCAPILGRQHFVPVYAYDGSIYIGHSHLTGKNTSVWTLPYVLQEAGFVVDWIDYWRQAKKQ